MGQEATALVLVGDTDYAPAPVPSRCWGCKCRAFCSLPTSVGGMEQPGDADAGLGPEQTLAEKVGGQTQKSEGASVRQCPGVWGVQGLEVSLGAMDPHGGW